MAAKKKTPREKRMNRERRLPAAKEWMRSYNGKHIVKSYSRRFGIDLPCAIKELRLLGVEVSIEYENAVKRSIEARARQKTERKLRGQENRESEIDSDEEFAFIAGYTSGGAPYGLRWEEMEDDPSACASPV